MSKEKNSDREFSEYLERSMTHKRPDPEDNPPSSRPNSENQSSQSSQSENSSNSSSDSE